MNDRHRNREWGQSLVEVAIFMPIILLLLGGVVEISNLLVAQNRVVTGTRAATSFGATNFREETLPADWDESMAGVALNSVINTPQADSALWDFAVVRAKTNAAGDGFDRWQMEYPNETSREDMPSSDELQSRVLSELGDGSAAAGIDLFITVAHSQYNSLLHLDSLFSAYPSELTAINVAMIDREQEPVLFCLDETETGVANIRGALDVAGNLLAPKDHSETVRTLRTWDAGSAQVEYTATNWGKRIAFNGSNLGASGLEETDHFRVVVEGSPLQVGVRIVTNEDANLVLLDVAVGEYATGAGGFTAKITEVTPAASGGVIVGISLTSRARQAGEAITLDEVLFKFIGSECTDWGIPADMGNYSSSLDS